MSDVSVAEQSEAAPATATRDRTAGADAPPVVAVVVAADPGEYFSEMLSSLGRQDYENLSVLVIDAGSEEPIADRVAEVLPDAYLHRITGEPGFSVAANQAIELVTGSPFLLFCHDDVVLDEQCVSKLMGELYRQNAGIAGPKMVRWDDDRKLLQLGMGADRFGVLVEQVERGEFDQEQYDPVRDVFVAPGGCQLVRADLFVALGGFDPAITLMGEDLDLCWRAHAVGARVLAVSAATVRHRESMPERLGARDRRKFQTRHRLRTVMVTAVGRARFTTVPTAMFLIVLEGLYYLLTGRRGQARDMFSAIGWNLTRTNDIRRRRRALRQIRQRSPKEVRAFQMGGSAALSNFSRGQFTSGQDRFSGFLGAVRSSFSGEDSGSLRDATVFILGLVALMAFSSRHLLTRGVVPVGQIPIVPGANLLFAEFWGGWRSAGTGGPGNPPTAYAILGLGRTLFFWAPSLFDKLIGVGPVMLGIFGAFRLTRPLGSARSAAIAAVSYATSPLIVSAFSAGRWESMVLFAAAPYLIGSLLRIEGLAPYGNRMGTAATRIVPRSLPVLAIRYGFLVAFVAAFAPSVVVLTTILALAMGLTAVLGTGGLRYREYGLALATAIVAPAALHLPWAYDVMRGITWRWLVGPQSAEAGVGQFFDLLLFAPGRPEASYFTFGVILVALIGLALATRQHFGFAAQGWAVALVMIGLVWAGGRGWIPFSLPAGESILAFAAAGLLLPIAAAVRAFEASAGEAKRPPLLRAAYAATFMGVLASVVGGLLMAGNGAWQAPTQSYSTFTGFLAEGLEEEIGDSRVLWIGDPSVVPVDVVRSPGGLSYAVTDGGVPEVWGRWSAGPVGRTDGVGIQLDLAREGETVRLGRLLAPYGIGLVIVVDQLAPAPYEGPQIDPGDGVVQALGQQLDLERTPGIPNLIVFSNEASGGVASALPTDAAAEAVTSADQLDVDLSSGPPVFTNQQSAGRWLLDVPGEVPVLLGAPNDGLRLNGQSDQLITGFDGLAVVPSSASGQVEVGYPTPIARRGVLVLQLIVLALGAVVAQTRREVQA
ncbi:MAG: glycosyltransferase family 2 protein [Actinomycetota bacterium]